jgi:hypothetical protein
MTLIKTIRNLCGLCIWTACLTYSLPSDSQTDSSYAIQWQLYSDLYYAYDFARPANHLRPDFLYNHKRHNEVNANLLIGSLNYHSSRTRANLGLMAGGYAQYNLSNEPTWAQHIYEANLGFRLSKKNNIWLDAGIMPSHIGFESAISSSCWTLTRSMVAENSPYYESGVKVSYTTRDDKLLVSLLWLNGWQKIHRPAGIQRPSFGMQILYLPTDRISVNYSNFAGTDQPDSLNAFRSYHNFYLQYTGTKRLGFTAGFDLGTDKDAQGKAASWLAAVGILQYKFTDRLHTAWRAEYFYDPKQIIISTATPNGFRTLGLSWNIDAHLTGSLLFRTELKYFQSRDAVFLNQSRDNWSITTGLSAKFQR